jgi:hypothetical protein
MGIPTEIYGLALEALTATNAILATFTAPRALGN